MAVKTICLVAMFALLLTGENINEKQFPSSGMRSSEAFSNSLPGELSSDIELENSQQTKSQAYLFFSDNQNSLCNIAIIIFALLIGIASTIIYLIKIRKMRNRYIYWLSRYLQDVQLLYCRFDESRKIADMLFDDSTDAGIMIKIHSDDLTTKIVCKRINRVFEEVFTIPHRQAPGKELHTLLPEIDCTKIYSAMHNTTRNTAHNFEYCYKTDKFFVVNISISDKSSACLRFTDITSHKKLITQLSEKSKNMEIATTAGNIGIWTWDIHHDRLDLSASYKKMLGYEEYELALRTESITRLIHPEDKEFVIDHFYRCTNGSIPGYSIEFRMKTKNGKWCWIRSNTQTVCDLKGSPIQLVGIHMDITEVKLLKNEFDIICNSSPIPLIILDEFQRIKKINQKAKEFGNPRSEAVGLRMGEWLKCKNRRRGCGGSPDCSDCKLAKLLETSASTQNMIGPTEIPFDIWQTNEKRVHLPLHFSVCVKNFLHDTKSYFAIWLEDISQQKQIDNNYKKMMDSMRQLNRTLNTQQIQLEALRKRAKKAEAAHQEFLNGISHEMCTSLSDIIGVSILKNKLPLCLPCNCQLLPETATNLDDDIIFSKDKLLRKAGKDPNQLKSVVNCFVREIPIMIASIEEYITTEDMKNAVNKARLIKGAANGIGAMRLQKAAEKLEFMAEQDDFSESINTMLCLEAEFECVKSALRNFSMEHSFNR